MSVLTSNFPFASDSRRLHVRFVHNILKIVDYAPSLHSDILSLVTERLVKIDVQVQGDLRDLPEDLMEAVIEELASGRGGQEDLFDDENSDDESDLDEFLDSQAVQKKEIQDNIVKLDILLDMLFSHYATLFTSPSSETRLFAFDALLAHFGSHILPTYRSRHTQFLLFHFAQTSPSLVDTFVGAVIHIAFDKSRPALIRQSAAAYLASFVSRGNHIPTHIVRDVFEYIGSQLALIRKASEPTCTGPDPRRYSTFYSLTQALLYIFCFRWRDLVTTSDDPRSPSPYSSPVDTTDALFPPSFLPSVKDTLSQTIFSPLNPLKVCAPPIVDEFARIANHLGVVYVFHLLETNKRVRLICVAPATAEQRETAISGKIDDEWYRLDAYFPFDPYRLPSSKRWIDGDYREWEDVPGLDDGEESSEEEDDDVEEGEEATATDEE